MHNWYYLANCAYVKNMRTDMTTNTLKIEQKEKALYQINKMIIGIIILNFLDGILTHIGVIKKYTVEINLLMVNIVSDFNKLLLYKLILPTIALVIVYYIFNKHCSRKMPVGEFMVKLCFWTYSIIMAMHIVWIAMVIYNSIPFSLK